MMKVAIIGAGPSGLTAIKACLEEGLLPVCLEQKSRIGGIWYCDDFKEHNSVYASVAINTSREMSSFSDFPVPQSFPPFMHKKIYLEYLEQYANCFDLEKYVRFNTRVQKVTKALNHEETGMWQVTSQEKTRDDKFVSKVELFDAVMVCNGHLSEPSWPDIPGMHSFRGLMTHSRFYKDHKQFEGKRVLVVGLGNTGADIAVELGRHASQVYLSTRGGAWVMSRQGNRGVPYDILSETRFQQQWPTIIQEYITARNIQSRFDHKKYGLLPTHGVLNAQPVISDALPHAIAMGSVIVKPNISHFSEEAVYFQDGTRVENLDAVVFCTGYKILFNFLEQEILPVKDNDVNLYKQIFPPHHRHPTFAVIGLVQSSGAFNSVAELQARLVVKVFTKKIKLPSYKEMADDIVKKKKELNPNFRRSQKPVIHVSSITYNDEIAEMIGCRPNLLRLFFTKPSVFFQCYFGPCLSHQYRLMGPGAWSGAEDAIRQSCASRGYPLSTSPPSPHTQQKLPFNFAAILKCLLFVLFSLPFCALLN